MIRGLVNGHVADRTGRNEAAEDYKSQGEKSRHLLLDRVKQPRKDIIGDKATWIRSLEIIYPQRRASIPARQTSQN